MILGHLLSCCLYDVWKSRQQHFVLKIKPIRQFLVFHIDGAIRTSDQIHHAGLASRYEFHVGRWCHRKWGLYSSVYKSSFIHFARLTPNCFFFFLVIISKFIHPIQNGRPISAEIRDLAVARWVFHLPPSQKPIEDLYLCIVRLIDALQSGTGSCNKLSCCTDLCYHRKKHSLENE